MVIYWVLVAIKSYGKVNDMKTKDIPLNMPCSDPEGCKHFKDVMKANERIKGLEDLLVELYDEASYLRAGEWVIENEDLQKRVIQALKP